MADRDARVLPFVYLLLLLVIPGVVWPGYHFAQGVDGATLLRDCFTTPGVSLIVADFLLVALVAVLWMVVEARRLGMRWALYLVAAICVPFAIVLPFYLYRRERVLGAAS